MMIKPGRREPEHGALLLRNREASGSVFPFGGQLPLQQGTETGHISFHIIGHLPA
jgi:hypothetical protein